jgi:hypothetical protein
MIFGHLDQHDKLFVLKIIIIINKNQLREILNYFIIKVKMSLKLEISNLKKKADEYDLLIPQFNELTKLFEKLTIELNQAKEQRDTVPTALVAEIQKNIESTYYQYYCYLNNLLVEKNNHIQNSNVYMTQLHYENEYNKDRISSLIGENDDLKGKNIQKDNIINNLHKEINNVESCLESKQNIINNLVNELEQYRRNHNHLSNTCKKYNNNPEIVNKVFALVKIVNNKNQYIKELEDQIENLQTEINEYKEIIGVEVSTGQDETSLSDYEMDEDAEEEEQEQNQEDEDEDEDEEEDESDTVEIEEVTELRREWEVLNYIM